jgi:predicted RND superfamily exporter protein
MKNRFFSRRVRFFGNVAIMILCAIFFLVPFSVRGARLAVQGIKNDVKDWLPAKFPETRVLDWFRQYFVGDQFVAVSWDGCSDDDPRFRLLVQKLRKESIDYEKQLSEENAKLFAEEAKAHKYGDELGLHTTGDYHVDWGQEREKWLLGHKDKWYYITRSGELYEWDGEKNVLSGLMYSFERFFNGSNRATGTLRAKFGTEEDNEFYENPEKLSCRFFKSIITGPDVLQQLAGEGGSLRQGGLTKEEAEILANQRLTGSLFGPTPSIGFDWSREAFNKELTKEQFAKYEGLPQAKELDYAFENYVQQLIDKQYDGKRYRLINATSDERIRHWFTFFYERRLEPPARTTCVLVTLNEPASKDLSRVVGRPVLGKPRGRIQELAISECGILESDLHLGGPPNDNVSIDEEGTITLIRLVGISTLIGWVLAYLSFRSIKISFMIFFVGGMSAITSLGIVYWGGSNLDAILMSMPSLIYVMGLSGAIHIVNYYREACHEQGPRGAAETAVRNGWFPCTLAAFTTALGLISLCTSTLTPIQKFGFFAAIGTMVTVVLLFTYLPSSLHLWSPGYKRVKETGVPHGSRYSLHNMVTAFWDRVGDLVIRYHWGVSIVIALMFIVFTLGLFKIQTSVQLVKLFAEDAKVLQDYRWLEKYLGQLVPMEVTINIPESSHLPIKTDVDGKRVEQTVVYDENGKIDYEETDLRLSFLERMEAGQRIRNNVEYWFGEQRQDIVGKGMSTDSFIANKTTQLSDISQMRNTFSQNLVQSYDQILGLGYLKINNVDDLKRVKPANEKEKTEFPDGYVLNAAGVKKPVVDPKPGLKNAELWRVSLRLGALKDVDYGRFVSDLKTVIEPTLKAYQTRAEIVRALHAQMSEPGPVHGKVLVLGWKSLSRPDRQLDIPDWNRQSKYSAGDFVWHKNRLLRCNSTVDATVKSPGSDVAPAPDPAAWDQITTLERFVVSRERINSNEHVDAYLLRSQSDDSSNGLYLWDLAGRKFTKLPIKAPVQDTEFAAVEKTVDQNVDQTVIFCETLQDLMSNRGFTGRADSELLFAKIDFGNLKQLSSIRREGALQKLGSYYDCIVMVGDHPAFDVEKMKENAKSFIDARDHVFHVNARTKDAISLTASQQYDLQQKLKSPAAELDPQLADQIPNQPIGLVAEYTGIVPIVYKAQRSLLYSLVQSICYAFLMIATTMMLLLRDWRSRPSLKNSLNVVGGITSMLPNVFPIVIIFGAMGHLGVFVDIGAMMTASVAMGVAVDDTIHFLSWYRQSLYQGKDRRSAIKAAYSKVATAMTQTTMIGGLGLSVFAWSTFTPTQRFGVMMLLLLVAALVGDLIFLPALLAGPLGRFFDVKRVKGKGAQGDKGIAIGAGSHSESIDIPLEQGSAGAQGDGVPDPDQVGTSTASASHKQVTPHSRQSRSSSSLLRHRKPE